MDIGFLSFLADYRNEFLTGFFSVLTYAGSEYIAIGIACLVYWCCSRKTGNRMLLTMMSSLMLNQLLKIIFVARRPWLRDPDRVRTVESAKADASGYSFPSGHTSNAAAIFGGLVYGDRVKRIWKIIAWVFVCLVAFSRMYLGVHTPQDVLAGILLSALMIYLMGKLSDKLEQKPSIDIYICIGAVALAITTLLVVLFRSFPADHLQKEIEINKQDAFKLVGAALGMAIGWFLERRIVGFDKPKRIVFGILRFIIGFILVLALIKLTKSPLISLFDSENWAGVVRYFIACFVAIFLWPLTFRAIEEHIDPASRQGKE